MPITHICQPPRELVISVWEGSVTAAEWMAHLRELQLDPGFPSTWKHLVDMCFGATAPSFGASEIQEGVDFLASRGSASAGRRVAIVTGADIKTARLFRDLAESARVTSEVFSDLHPACAWLAINREEAAAVIAALREKLTRKP